MICVATINGARGVNGDVRLRTFTAAPETVARFGTLYSADGQKTYALQSPKVINGDLVSRIDCIGTREEALALKGTELFVPRDALPDTDDSDEFYITDLIGLAVRDDAGEVIGRVQNIDNFGASDVLEISLTSGAHSDGESPEGAALKGNSLMLPFTKAMVPAVDIASGEISVVIPPELGPELGTEFRDEEVDENG